MVELQKNWVTFTTRTRMVFQVFHHKCERGFLVPFPKLFLSFSTITRFSVKLSTIFTATGLAVRINPSCLLA